MNYNSRPQSPYGQPNGQPQYGQYDQPQYAQQAQPQYGQPNTQMPYGQSYGQQQFNQQYMNQQYVNPTAQGGPTVMDATAVSSSDTIFRATQISTARAYGEMTIGIAISALVALMSQATGLLYTILSVTGAFGWIGLAIAQVALAIALGAKVMSMNPSTARVLFYVYAALMGLTLSSIFAVYSLGSIVLALALTAGFFLCLTMLALTTKIDMLKAGPILLTALMVFVVAQVILMFVAPGALGTMLFTGIGILLFAGLTAYDAQSTRALFQQYAGDTTMMKRVSILCALNLYLDFINMFMYVLRLVGSER